MPAKPSARIRYEKRLYRLNSRKRDWLEEMAVEVEVLEGANERLFSDKQKLADCLDDIIRVLNIRFGIGWIETEFDASNYGANDSINASQDIAQIIRSTSGYCTKGEAIK